MYRQTIAAERDGRTYAVPDLEPTASTHVVYVMLCYIPQQQKRGAVPCRAWVVYLSPRGGY